MNWEISIERSLQVNEVEPFKHYFSETGEIKYDELDALDYEFTRREILARYLLVNVVPDQGPDMLVDASINQGYRENEYYNL